MAISPLYRLSQLLKHRVSLTGAARGVKAALCYPGDANAKSIRLAFVRAHVAAGGFRSPGTRQAALVGLQKVPCKVTAAGGIAGVKRRASFLQRHCFGGTSVLVQRA